MVKALDSWSSGLGSSPGGGHCVVFLGKTLTVPLSTQVYKWVPANLMLVLPGDELEFRPGGSRNTLSRFLLLKPG